MAAGGLILLWSVLGFFVVERMAEIAINSRNSRVLRLRGARWLGEDGFRLILTAQVALFAGVFVESMFTPWVGMRPWTWLCLMLLLLAQLVRYWCIATLGWRWSIRVVTVPDAPRIAAGPYRWFPHPNYAVVLAEAILLPLAFGAYGTLILVAPLQLVALWRRVRLEEGALSRIGSR